MITRKIKLEANELKLLFTNLREKMMGATVFYFSRTASLTPLKCGSPVRTFDPVLLATANT